MTLREALDLGEDVVLDDLIIRAAVDEPTPPLPEGFRTIEQIPDRYLDMELEEFTQCIVRGELRNH